MLIEKIDFACTHAVATNVIAALYSNASVLRLPETAIISQPIKRFGCGPTIFLAGPEIYIPPYQFLVEKRIDQ